MDKRTIYIIGIIIFGIFILSITAINGPRITGFATAVKEDYMKEIVCKQEPYSFQEAYKVQEPYQDTEYYRTNENSKNCDDDRACSCTHKSWLGFGSCDSCNCERSRTFTNYRTVTKYRTATATKEVCIKIWKLSKPNYQESWENHPDRI